MAKKKSASLVFSYFGDSKFKAFFQEAQNIGKSFEGYDYNVLLKHENKEVGIDLNQKDEKRADIKETPTADNFSKYVQQLTEDDYMIDIWIFSHGSRKGFRVSKGTYGKNDYTWEEDIEKELKRVTGHLGLKKLPIRLVYQVNCWGKNLNDMWYGLGAKTSVGSRYVNFYPNQYGKFANNWNDNVRVKKALNEADTAASRTIVQTYLSTIDAPSTREEWGECPFGKFVLGDDPCAKKYFTKRWPLSSDEWQKNKNGKENMNYSSQMCIKGDEDLKKNDVPSWD